MHWSAVVAVPTIAFSLFLAPSAQRRAEEKAPPKFEEVMSAASKAWSSQHYGRCVESLQQGLQLAQKKRRSFIIESMPAAPAGWTKVAPKPQDDLANNPFAAQMMAAVGNVITQDYTEDAGRGKFTITITTESPMVQMFGMMLQNPALLKQQGGEIIEYDQAKAVLKKASSRLTLEMVVAEKSYFQGQGSGLTEDQLFALVSQGNLDKLIALTH